MPPRVSLFANGGRSINIFIAVHNAWLRNLFSSARASCRSFSRHDMIQKGGTLIRGPRGDDDYDDDDDDDDYDDDDDSSLFGRSRFASRARCVRFG